MCQSDISSESGNSIPKCECRPVKQTLRDPSLRPDVPCACNQVPSTHWQRNIPYVLRDEHHYITDYMYRQMSDTKYVKKIESAFAAIILRLLNNRRPRARARCESLVASADHPRSHKQQSSITAKRDRQMWSHERP